MDFLSRAIGQLSEVFRSMTPAARITTGLLLISVVVSLVYLVRFDSENADEFLFGAKILSQREIANMEIAFGKAQLNGWEVEQQRIKVPRAERADYLAALAASNAYPEHPGAPTAEMLRQSTRLDSRGVFEQRAMRAKVQELESVLQKWSGIEEAFVNMDESESGDGLRKRKERHVMVAARGFGGTFLDEQLVRSIRAAVASATGAERKNVSVTDLNSTQTHYDASGDGTAFGEEDIYAVTQRNRENHYKQKIQQSLRTVQGALVEVYVQLDEHLKHHTTTTKYDQPTSLATNDYQKEVSSSSPQNAGVPGATSNGVGNRGVVAENTNQTAENTTNESRNEVKNVAGSTQEVAVRAPLVTKYVSASIKVPWSYYVKVWHSKNPEAEDTPPPQTDLEEIETDTIAMIQESVKTILGPDQGQGADEYPRISVQTIYDTPLPSPPGPSLADTAGSWFNAHWQTLGMFLMAAVGIWMLRGMIRATDNIPQASAPTIPLDELTVFSEDSDDEPVEGDEDESDLANSLKARFQHSGRSLRDELTELVREDPDAAANVLQNWIGDAA